MIWKNNIEQGDRCGLISGDELQWATCLVGWPDIYIYVNGMDQKKKISCWEDNGKL